MSDMSLIIKPVRAFADNYIWVIDSADSDVVAVVDPGDAAPVLAWLEQAGKRLEAVLITHFHRDHTGGISRLRAAFPDCRVHGPARESIDGLTDRHGEGDVIELAALGARFDVMDVPGHTAGHIAYSGHGLLFCGDTLFACGCGRVFDGTFEQLAQSLLRIAAMPPETLIYCAHEYTIDNIGFAKWVEPENEALLAREQRDMAAAEQGMPTVPSTLALELATNPFMRLSEPTVVAAAQARMKTPTDDPVAVFRALREWKDREYD